MMDVASSMLDDVVKLPGQLMGDPALAVHEVAQLAKGSRKWFRLFRTNGILLVVEEDEELLVKKARINHVEQQLGIVSEQDKLHDYSVMLLAVDNAFYRTLKCIVNHPNILSEVALLQPSIEKQELRRTRMHKIKELKETLKVTEGMLNFLQLGTMKKSRKITG